MAGTNHNKREAVLELTFESVPNFGDLLIWSLFSWFERRALTMRNHVVNFYWDQEPVSQKSRNLSSLFPVLQFPLYLRNTEILSDQISQSSWFFLR